MIPLPGLGAAGKAIPLTLTQREKKGGQRSATGHQSMKTSSPGKVPQQSFMLGLSQRSSNASTSVRTRQLIPPMWSGRSSSHLDAQTSLQTSGSTLSRGLQSTLPRSLGPTTPLMSRLSSPKTLETSSRSPFEFQSSPRPSGPMETGSSPLGRPSKRLLSPCQDDMLNILPTKRICQHSSPLSRPHSTLESLTSTRPSDCEQPIKSTFASLILPDLMTSGPFTSPPLVWVQVPQMEAKGVQGKVPGLPMQEGKSPATTGIEAPATSSHRNAPTSMSATAVGVGEPTDIRSVQSQSLNQELSRGQKFRRHFVWDPAAAVRSRTVCWTETAEPLPSLTISRPCPPFRPIHISFALLLLSI